MNWFYAGLPLAFVILSLLLILVLVKASINKWLKLIFIPIIFWYGFVVSYTPLQLMGWPTELEPTDGALIVSWHVIEPRPDFEGGIYLWIIDRKKDWSTDLSLDPRSFITYFAIRVPRGHRLTYDLYLHLDLLKKQKEKEGVKGLLFYKKPKKGDLGVPGKKRKHEEGFEDDSRFKVIDPIKLLDKEGERSSGI